MEHKQAIHNPNDWEYVLSPTEVAHYANIPFAYVANVSARFNRDLLILISPDGIAIPETLGQYGNACWANVVMLVMLALERKFTTSQTKYLIYQVIQAKSHKSSPYSLTKILCDMNLPVMLVEYCIHRKLGPCINDTTTGEMIGLVNTGNHYQVWLIPGSTLTSRVREIGHMMFPRANQKCNKNAWKKSGKRRRRRKNRNATKDRYVRGTRLDIARNNQAPKKTHQAKNTLGAWVKPPLVINPLDTDLSEALRQSLVIS